MTLSHTLKFYPGFCSAFFIGALICVLASSVGVHSWLTEKQIRAELVELARSRARLENISYESPLGSSRVFQNAPATKTALESEIFAAIATLEKLPAKILGGNSTLDFSKIDEVFSGAHLRDSAALQPAIDAFILSTQRKNPAPISAPEKAQRSAVASIQIVGWFASDDGLTAILTGETIASPFSMRAGEIHAPSGIEVLRLRELSTENGGGKKIEIHLRDLKTRDERRLFYP